MYIRRVFSNMVHKEFHCIFILIIIQISSALVYNIKPSSYNSSMNCTSSAFCFELNDITTLSFEFNNAQLQLLAGNHKLNKQITLYDVRNFSIIGKQVLLFYAHLEVVNFSKFCCTKHCQYYIYELWCIVR